MTLEVKAEVYERLQQMGSSIAVDNRSPVQLTDPEYVYLVQDGEIDIFSQLFQDKNPVGRRHYVQTLNSGSLLLCHAFSDKQEEHRLIAVGVQQTKLLRVSVAKLEQSWDDGLLPLIDEWIEFLCGGLRTGPFPRVAQSGTLEASLSLPSGSVLSAAEEVLWLQSDSEEIRFSGRLVFTPGESVPVLPLTRSSWIKTLKDESVSVMATRDVVAGSLLNNSVLNRFFDYFSQVVAERQNQELKKQMERLSQSSLYIIPTCKKNTLF